MNFNQISPAILYDGSRTRLWRPFRSGFSKQLLVPFGDDSKKSLFQQALESVHTNVEGDLKLGSTLIFTNGKHRFFELDQLHELRCASATLLLEPNGINTVPKLTLAGPYVKQQSVDTNNNAIFVLIPANQAIQNGPAFAKGLQ